MFGRFKRKNRGEVASKRISDNEAALIGLEKLWHYGRAK